MRYGVSCISVVPVRATPDEKGEMCTQILFGEKYRVIEEAGLWGRVRLDLDGYEGWVDKKMLNVVGEREYSGVEDSNSVVTTEMFSTVRPVNGDRGFPVVAGSTLPHYDVVDRVFRIGADVYSLEGDGGVERSGKKGAESVIGNAAKYYNAPYLWGGRSPVGIDCSGLTQILYKMAGVSLPRDASQQVVTGERVEFVGDALPGDLAFFSNDKGEIVHVGIMRDKDSIIHSSGRVRVDRVSQRGIIDVNTGEYTHKMSEVRRVLLS